MDQKPRQLRAIGLLLATGFASGLFVQYNVPGVYFAPPPKDAPIESFEGGPPPAEEAGQAATESTASVAAAPGEASEAPGPRMSDNGTADEVAAPEPSVEPAVETLPETPAATAPEPMREAAQPAPEQAKTEPEPPPDEATPEVLRRYDAIAAVVGNTLAVPQPGGGIRHVYFAPRGVVAEFFAREIEARPWTRDDDHLCRSFGVDMRECFYLTVQLAPALRKGSVKALDDRLRKAAPGSLIGAVQGFGDGEVKLLRGDVRGLPDYVPLLEDKPGPEWTRDSAPFVGALLLRKAEDENRAATFFAPNGQVFEVTRLTRRSVGLSIGAWRRQGELVCRSVAGGAEECAHPHVSGERIEFTEAAPSRRAYLRAPWPDEDPGERAEQRAAEVTLAPMRSRAYGAGQGSFTDLR